MIIREVGHTNSKGPGYSWMSVTQGIINTRRAGWPGFNSHEGQWWDFFSSPPRPDLFWSPPSLLYSGTGALSPEVKRPEREADHLPPSNAEVKNVWCYISILQYILMVWCLVRAQGQLCLYFILLL